jgi:hypothetical protein
MSFCEYSIGISLRADLHAYSILSIKLVCLILQSLLIKADLSISKTAAREGYAVIDLLIPRVLYLIEVDSDAETAEDLKPETAAVFSEDSIVQLRALKPTREVSAAPERAVINRPPRNHQEAELVLPSTLWLVFHCPDLRLALLCIGECETVRSMGLLRSISEEEGFLRKERLSMVRRRLPQVVDLFVL